MTDKIIVFSTCGTEEEAEKIARELVETRVAACVSILPGARSIYRWQGAIEAATEWILVIKSSRELFGELRTTLEKTHSYEVPELLALQVVEAAPNYLNWLEGQLRA
jgi:periplasmic divalent cation tolerance protein